MMPRNAHAHRYIYARPALVISFLLLLMSLRGGTDFWSLERTVSAATTFTVNSTGDSADSNLFDGVCNDGTGACTLRAAIQQANNVSGNDIITFNLSPAGIITLNTALPDITDNLTITGPGSNLLTVMRSTAGGTPVFRIFTISNGRIVSISGLTITNGRTADGAPAAD